MKLHILGICGTFMGGLAALARERGDVVEGSDQGVYPPMSTQLEALGIALSSPYAAANISPDVDEVVVGNALSRGNPAVEHVLDAGLRYTSGAQWLAERVLPGRTVLAVAGTHGKTTTTALLAWLIESQGGAPGFLIGGAPGNFDVSARRGDGECFVVEADEYDTAFFDKRSKFVHYRPRIAILNNLEYDHADIFPDLDAIKRQFHHLVRTVPRGGKLIVNAEEASLRDVLAMGCWTPVETFAIARDTDGAAGAVAGANVAANADTAAHSAAKLDAAANADWQARLLDADGSRFEVIRRGESLGDVAWPLLGRHNVMNALAALAAAEAAGFDARATMRALPEFRSARRRLELLGEADGTRVYDDFAHHPTAIRTTLAGLRARVGDGRVVVALEPRSNSMRLGAHAEELAPSLDAADLVVFLRKPDLPWDAERVIAALRGEGVAAPTVDALLAELAARVRPGDQVVFMSNGGFEGAPRRFAQTLRKA